MSDVKLEVRKLSMGDELRAKENSVTIKSPNVEEDSVSMVFDRPVTEEDVRKIMTVYAMGSAARSRYVNTTFNVFIQSFDLMEITGFNGPEHNG